MRKMTSSGARLLTAAIIEQSWEDYIDARFDIMKSRNPIRKIEATATALELESFWISEWFMDMVESNPNLKPYLNGQRMFERATELFGNLIGGTNEDNRH